MTGDKRPRPSAIQRFLNAGILPRVVVILVMVPCLYFITLRGGVFFLILADLIILLGLREFYVLMKAKGYQPFEVLGYFCAMAISWYAWRQGVPGAYRGDHFRDHVYRLDGQPPGDVAAVAGGPGA